MRSYLSIALVFLLVFLAGGVVGWSLRKPAEPQPRNIIEQGGRKLWTSGSAAERTDKFIAEFDKELELNPDQTAGIRAIVEPTMKDYIRYDREHMRLRKAAHDNAVDEIRPLLDPAQQEKLDALSKSSNRRFQRVFRNVDVDE